MIFASYTYIVFLILCFGMHWVLPSRMRKPFLIAASYTFYCSWKWEYGFLLLAVSLFSWGYGLFLSKREGDERLLFFGVAIELCPLLYFKYTGFFLENLAALTQFAGSETQIPILEILLPLGISFFTFQGIAYLVDVATGEKPFQRLGDFLLYKSFWPQLIAGPIVRPGEISQQIGTARTLSYDDIAEGSRRILLGLFKKVVLADTLAPYADTVFVLNARPGAIDGVVGIMAFGMQIYWDFSGYSDIAIGSARLFGYRFPENFDWPYSARSPQEFWNRWHMTLSRWIRDYVFFPLQFASRGHPKLALLWLVAAMALCGLWHGARWTFVLWGVWHGCLLVLHQTWLKPLFAGTEASGKARSSLRGLLAMALTLLAVNAGWLLFRAQDMDQVLDIARAVLTLRGGIRPTLLRENAVLLTGMFFGGMCFAGALSSFKDRIANFFVPRQRLRTGLAAGFYCLAITAIVIFDQEAKAFVYFQF